MEKEETWGGRTVGAAIKKAIEMFGHEEALRGQLERLEQAHSLLWGLDQEKASLSAFDQTDPPWGVSADRLFRLLDSEQTSRLRARIDRARSA